jgi:histidine ammonia-lyase
MTVVLSGDTLTIEETVRVARAAEPVELSEDALRRMAAARAVVERTLADGVEAYGVTTGVGVRLRFRDLKQGHDALLLRQHLIAQGPPLAADVVRAAALRLANAFAQGLSAARPELAQLLVARLNDGRLPAVRSLGSVGQSDLALTAELAVGVLGDDAPAPGEGIALLNQSPFAAGHAALAVHDLRTLLETMSVAGALDLEALAANREQLLHPAIASARPSPGVREALGRLRALVAGSGVTARALQDPLTFRTLPQHLGAARDALAFVETQVGRELNAHQSNPLVVVDEQRLVSLGDFEVVGLATALDLARLILGQVLTTAAGRTVKLLQAHLTGLPEGLGARPGLAESALSELGISAQSIASEARLLAHPVSLELVSTDQAGGIEDRMTMAPLAARRLAEQVVLGARLVAIELLVAAQACDLRAEPLAPGAARAHAAVREVVPFVGEGDPLPELEPLVARILEGGLADL